MNWSEELAFTESESVEPPSAGANSNPRSGSDSRTTNLSRPEGEGNRAAAAETRGFSSSRREEDGAAWDGMELSEAFAVSRDGPRFSIYPI